MDALPWALFGRIEHKVEQQLGDPGTPLRSVGSVTFSRESVEDHLMIEESGALFHGPDAIAAVLEDLRSDLGASSGSHAFVGVDPNSCHC
jgi:hypothetical protein